MKLSITTAIATIVLGAASVTALATDGPAPKGPPKTMGDEGKLPPANTMRNAVPDMTGPNAGDASTGASTGSSGSASRKGPAVRMGDEPGKLPATGTVSKTVPEMRGADPQQ